MYDNADVYRTIAEKIKPLFSPDRIQWENQSDFKPPLDDWWVRVSVQYSDSVPSGIHFGQLERDYGIISLQCFSKKGNGVLELLDFCRFLRDEFKGWTHEYLQVYQTHAPAPLYSDVNDNYFGYVVRIDFRVN